MSTATISTARNYPCFLGLATAFPDTQATTWAPAARNTGSSTPLSLRSVRFTSNLASNLATAVESNQSFYVNSPLALWGSTIINGVSCQLRDATGNVIGTPFPRNDIDVFIATLVPYNRYILSFSVNATLPVNSSLARLSAFVANNVFDYFEGGFNNQLPLNGNVTLTTDIAGQFLYTFTNYALENDQRYDFASAIEGIQAGTATVTSSDTNFFPTYTQTFTVQNSIDFILQSSSTGTFTGTVSIGVIGVGAAIPVNFVPVCSSGLANQSSVGVARARKAFIKKLLKYTEEDKRMDIQENVAEPIPNAPKRVARLPFYSQGTLA